MALIEKITPHLARLTESRIDRLVESGDILADENFSPAIDGAFGQFYAPFDWINDNADIILIGITPGRRQAKAALKALRNALSKGRSPTDAAAIAKEAASFDGSMQDMAAKLMDRFELHKLFGLRRCADLFGSARHRAHYTSILRNPVLQSKAEKQAGETKSYAWFDYSGGDSAFKVDLLTRSIAQDFEPEITHFKNAWLVPFGPTPATALERMAQRGLIDARRILPGLNHPSGTQQNRHNCQLNVSSDHSKCAPNVGCDRIRGRSRQLEKVVAERLSCHEIQNSFGWWVEGDNAAASAPRK
ncbi:MAG TPA: hypothetical protein VIF02_05190 [Methylocella sp.]